MKKKGPEKNKALAPAESSFLFYTTEDGGVKIGVRLENETVWLTQKAIAELFGVETPAISKHLTNIMKRVSYRERQLFPFWKQFARKEGDAHLLDLKRYDCLRCSGCE